MRFSVVIPVYNRPNLVRATLRSVFQQEYDNYEIIVVDDGSTDETISVLNALGDRIRLLQQQNRGPGAARNRGIRASRGDYVAFLDSDDLWFPWTLNVYESIIEDYDHPAFVAGSPYRFEGEQAEALGEAKHSEITTEAFPDYYSSSDQWRWWGVSSFVMKKDALHRTGGFTARNVNSEDADLAMRMGVESGFVHVSSGATFAYREHDENLMGAVDKNASGAHYMIDQEKEGVYPGGEARKKERWRILTRHIRPVSLACLREGYTDIGWRLYSRTMGWNLALSRWRYLSGFPLRALQYTWKS